jgi:ribosomal protein S18 acetylase RimI-like enzyme
MGEHPLILRPATLRDQGSIIRLIDEAAAWLRTKETDQWAKPWRNEEDRRERITRDLQAGKTWILLDDEAPVATLTADMHHDHQEMAVWPPRTRQDIAVYVCRLVVSRNYARKHLGAALLDWAGLSAREQEGAQWIRVDVWTSNFELHAYYRRQGFQLYDYSEDDEYPSGALFQKPTEFIHPGEHPMFRVQDGDPLG